MIARLLVRLLLALAFVAPVATAQLKDICFVCKGQGWMPCTSNACKQAKVCGIKMPHQCDEIYKQPCCHGIGKIVCERCHDPVAEADIKVEADKRMEWVARMQAIDAKCMIKSAHVESERWIIHWTIPTWRIGGEDRNRMRASHVFAERIEQAAGLIEKTLGDKADGKLSMFMVASTDEAMKTTLGATAVGHANGVNSYGPQGLSITRPVPGKTDTDERFWGACIHNAAHIAGSATGADPHSDFHMKIWVDEAFAHWVEIERFKRPVLYCVHEVRVGKDSWEEADWKKLICAEVGSGKDPSFGKLITQELDKANGRDRAYNWSYLDFLIKTKPEEFKTFFKELRTTKDTKKALDKAFGWSTAILQEKWHAYVIKTYAP